MRSDLDKPKWTYMTLNELTNQRVESKFDKYISSTRFLFNFLFGSNIFQFSAIDHKGHFRKTLTWIFEFDWFTWYHSYIS